MNDFINKMGEYWSQLSFDKLGDILTYHHNAPILFSSGLFFFLFIGFLIIYMSLRKHLLTRIIYVTLFSISLSSTLVQEENNARMAAHVINIFFISNYSNC